MDACGIDGCGNKLYGGGYCLRHRREQVAGVPFSPPSTMKRPPRRTVCTFEGCDRPYDSNGFCKGHDRQRRSGHGMAPLGDKAYKSRIQRAARLAVPEEERKARSALMVAARGPRTLEHARRLSVSHKIRAAAGVGNSWSPEEDRTCSGCSGVFTPNTPRHWACTPECLRLTKRLQRYGLTQHEWQAMYAAQDGRCALCGDEAKGWGTGTHGRLHIDHCHATGKTRALLCGECNTAIGRFGDDPQRLRAAADYLERHAAS